MKNKHDNEIVRKKIIKEGIKVDVTVKYLLRNNLLLHHCPITLFPKQFLGKNKKGDVRTQEEARVVCSKVRQIVFRENNLKRTPNEDWQLNNLYSFRKKRKERLYR